ncbi:MAG: DpnD/PcfM family protein [Oscillospiraceae bacterium]|nr:DpnD/PcfM family protein [Oscillospiraceae bacterium]
MTYEVLIEELVSQEFEVEAESADEARQIAEDKYYKGEFVVGSGNVSYREIGVKGSDGCYRGFREF